MAQIRRIFLNGGEIAAVSGAGAGGDPAAQLESIVADCLTLLAEEGLSREDIALTRLWMSDRDSAAKLNDVRDRLLRGALRSASSSFFSRQRMRDGGAVSVEFYAARPQSGASRRIVEFDPPRRYAHYLATGDWLFLSGMAEEGETMDLQFDRAFAQVEAALEAEGFTWSEAACVNLFLQRGTATAGWFLDRFRKAAPALPPVLTFETVDELANTPKHLEIELIARRRRP
ncbi:MAG: RidA family protein [Beijerinckiaceae bacterium]